MCNPHSHGGKSEADVEVTLSSGVLEGSNVDVVGALVGMTSLRANLKCI